MGAPQRQPNHGLRNPLHSSRCGLGLSQDALATNVAPGISTFTADIAGRDVVIWSDNTGAEHTFKKGARHLHAPARMGAGLACMHRGAI